MFNKIMFILTFVFLSFTNTAHAAQAVQAVQASSDVPLYETYKFDCRLQNNEIINIFLHNTEVPYLQIEATKYMYYGTNSVQEFLFKHTEQDVIISLQYVDSSLSLMHFKNAEGLVTVLKCYR